MGAFSVFWLILSLGLPGFINAQGTDAQGGDEEASESRVQAETPEEANAKQNNQGVERIEVTGSRIKRISVEGPAPITIINRDYLDRTGHTSVGEVLRDSTTASFGVGRESAGSSSGDSVSIGLRGQGAGRTLVLLNGKRLPPDGARQVVDLNMIPMIAVDRIEVLKDSASSLYGSDAVGGVVNIITKKNFSGLEVYTKYMTPQDKGGGQTEELGLVTGLQKSKWSVMGIFQYRSNRGLLSKDRDWTAQNISPIGSPGSYAATGGNVTPDPACPANRRQNQGGGNIFCSFNAGDYAWESQDIKHYNATLDGSFKLSEAVTLYGTLLGGIKDIYSEFAPSPGVGLKVPAGHNMNGLPNSEVKVYYRFLEAGNRRFSTTNNNLGGFLGAKGYLTDTWDWDLTFGYHTLRRVQTTKGSVNKARVIDLLSSGAYDPFEAAGNRGSISSALAEAENVDSANLKTVDLVFSGELLDLATGPLSAAVGVSGQQSNFSQKTDGATARQEIIGSAGSNASGKRDVYSGFAELSAPIKDLEVTLSGRFDHYSDFGATVNPKLGLKYMASEKLMLRSSVGTAFLAPALDALYGEGSYGNPSFIDKVNCKNNGVCKAQQYTVEVSANPDLKEEKALTASFGSVLQATESLNFGLDLWYLNLDNVVGIDAEAVTEAEAKFGSAYVANKGITVTRSAKGTLDSISGKALNLQESETLGLDGDVSFAFGSLFGHRLSIKDELSYLFWMRVERFPGLGKKDQLKQTDGAPRWRNNVSLIAGSDRQEFSFKVRTIAKSFKSDWESGEELPMYTEYDFNYSREFRWNGSLGFGVKNLFRSTPPLDDTARQGDGLKDSLYSPLGRVFYLSYRQGF